MNDRRCDSLAGRIKIGGEVWVAMGLAIVAGIYGYGVLNSSVANQAEKITTLEKRSDQLQTISSDVAVLKSQMEFLVTAERRREERGGRNP